MMTRRLIKNNTLMLLGGALFSAILLFWILYALLGTHLIHTFYENDSIKLIDMIMGSRAITPVDHYIQRADSLVVYATVWAILGFVGLAIVLSNPVRAALMCFSLFFFLSLLFLGFEFFPTITAPIQPNFLDYYKYRSNYLPDNILIYREKPSIQAKILNFKGAWYSSSYNIDVTPNTIEWITDKDGFRNEYDVDRADIVVLGDSYMEYGDTVTDTFGKRLEQKLVGLQVINLSKSGYGPIQYMEVLRRYGVSMRPKYVIFGLYEGNDLSDIDDYMRWWNNVGTGRDNWYRDVYTALGGNFFQRYHMALMSTIRFTQEALQNVVGLSMGEIRKLRGYPHPDVAIVSVGEKNYPMLLKDTQWTRYGKLSSQELAKSDEVKKLKEVLREFSGICKQHGVMPIVLYIPTATHIYAEHTTSKSGIHWLNSRQRRINSKRNVEQVIVNLVEEVNLPLMSLSPVFEQAAEEGEMLYYAMDPHWNGAGREMAAAFVAKAFSEGFLSLPAEKVQK